MTARQPNSGLWIERAETVNHLKTLLREGTEEWRRAPRFLRRCDVSPVVGARRAGGRSWAVWSEEEAEPVGVDGGSDGGTGGGPYGPIVIPPAVRSLNTSRCIPGGNSFKSASVLGRHFGKLLMFRLSHQVHDDENVGAREVTGGGLDPLHLYGGDLLEFGENC